MPELQMGVSAFDRDRGNFPDFPVVNMLAEVIPLQETPVLQSRPGLAVASTMGSGPIKQLFFKDGILNSRIFGVSDNNVLYESSTPLDVIDGDGYFSMDGFENRLFVTGGKQLWQYDGAAVSAVAFPGGGDVLNIVVGTSRLIAIHKDSGQFYWSDVLSPTIGTLSFATAENSPDRLKQLLFQGDQLILFGTETVEFWVASSANPLLPFVPIVGRTLSIGVRDTGCATLFNGGFAWITNKNQIYFGDQRENISQPSLDEKISKSLTAKLWTFRLEGVEHLAVTLDDSTWVLSSKTSTWTTFESYEQTNWIPHCAAQDFFGSSIDGSLIQWTDDHKDFGAELERRFRAGQDLSSGVAPLFMITMIANIGQTPNLTGTFADPKVGMRVSRDGGFTWTPYYDRKLGVQGAYKDYPRWRSMGYARPPGVLLEFRVVDPVPFRVSKVILNDPPEDL